MSDEWNVPGWTAQKPATIFSDAVNMPWRIPDDIDIVEVEAKFGDMDGGRPWGYVEFKASTSLIHIPTGTDLGVPDYKGVIGMDGNCTMRIPATDSSVLSPGFTYHVTVVRGRTVVDEFDCTLTKAVPQVSLYSLNPDSPTTENYTITIDGGTA